MIFNTAFTHISSSSGEMTIVEPGGDKDAIVWILQDLVFTEDLAFDTAGRNYSSSEVSALFALFHWMYLAHCIDRPNLHQGDGYLSSR